MGEKGANAFRFSYFKRKPKGGLDITDWLVWFLSCLDRGLSAIDEILTSVLNKARYLEWLATKHISDRQRLKLNKLLNGFDGKLTTSKWAKIANYSHDTALRNIQQLMDPGILVKESGGRSTSYILSDIVR